MSNSVQLCYLVLQVLRGVDQDVDDVLGQADQVEDDEDEGDEVAGELPATPLDPGDQTLTEAPAEEETQGHHHQDQGLEAADADLSYEAEPHVGTEVEVQQEDGDGEDDGGEDGHPGEDVEEEADQAGQLADHDDPCVDGDAVEEVDHALVDLKQNQSLLFHLGNNYRYLRVCLFLCLESLG